MGEVRLQSKRGDPSHVTTFPFFSDPNGNKVSYLGNEQEKGYVTLPSLPYRFHHPEDINYTNTVSTTYVTFTKLPYQLT